MRLALHINDYSSLGPPDRMAPALARVARTAEEAGFARLSLTDHVWQISMLGEQGEPMLEAYTTLGYLAGQTRSIELQTLVTAATYRPPGLLAKIVATLDVLAGGRAWLGIGAGWNEQEATGLGLPFGAHAERFARLEETVQICDRMWGPGEEAYVGEHYRLASTLNSPRPLRRPRPGILIGGGGERTTLRLAARYADAFNVHGGTDAGQKADRLLEHCARIGRDPDEIERTAVLPNPAEVPADPGRLLAELRRLHELGFTTVFTVVPDVGAITPLEAFATKVIPEISTW
ncbi:TIGR03560 family F420-dependent LLM class oxidoreductase [Actinomadura sp. LD22]|uniref:TIGR03560 family F420-dependent LLM class oxidoreductase n=1 Tax=Actinomadura physcomitrii TaxID=2650748 RepID=A0A6I4M203_9ACTN|nr:TIGR03560 family F420-dependent LLM class oxidoreductase [Actinomadura physcomitrii]MVZ99792.1 TIGR03560 family F420-dependent LLM class oxidoreductase [Actinomadura physcomitrii]